MRDDEVEVPILVSFCHRTSRNAVGNVPGGENNPKVWGDAGTHISSHISNTDPASI